MKDEVWFPRRFRTETLVWWIRLHQRILVFDCVPRPLDMERRAAVSRSDGDNTTSESSELRLIEYRS